MNPGHQRLTGKWRRCSQFILIGIVISVLFTSQRAYADTPYKTYTEGGYLGVTETQTAYTPLTSITKIGDYSFKNASDMKITGDDEIYIADTEGKRVLVSDIEGNLLKIYGEGVLTNPVGIFVTPDKFLYVADKNAGKIIVFNPEGDVIKEYTKPSHPLYGEEMNFKPQKIAVDGKGIMYIICEGNTNGIVQISPTEGGTFLGYFGTNITSLNFFNIFRRMILSEEQLAKLPRNLPKTPYNLTIDSKGLLYTVTQGDIQSLRKLNVAGKNLLEPVFDDGLPAAVTVGNYENIYSVSEQGYIFEYNKDGSILFVFGGKDSGRLRIGLFQRAVAIGVDKSNNLYVLDQEKNEIQIFKTTEFTDLVHEALQLYQNGKYTESKEPLSKIIEMNSIFDYANLAMGQALLQEENYTGALKYFRLSGNVSGYSDAFWEVRNIWLRDNIVSAIGIILLIFILIKSVFYVQRKKHLFSPITQRVSKATDKITLHRLSYMLYFMKHPIDGCYGVKRQQKSSYLSANILMMLFIIVNLFHKYGSGFILRTASDGRYDIFGDVIKIVVVFVLCTICSYLVSTISDGEGTLKQLYSAYVYALAPYIVLKPIIILISNVVTLNEKFIVQFADFLMYSWIIVLLFMAIKEVNNYSVMETVKIIFLTVFCALITVLLLFILYVLISQVTDFIQSIYGEVVYRFENS